MKRWPLVFALLLPLGAWAQGSLQFNQVRVIDNNTVTIPSGKVWKVISVYGLDYRTNECIDYSNGSTHEVGQLVRCSVGSSWPTGSFRYSYAIRGLIIDGRTVPTFLSGFRNGSSCDNTYTTTNCTGSQPSCFNLSQLACVNQTEDTDVLPLWLPAGAQVASTGAGTRLSVIEFNVVP